MKYLVITLFSLLPISISFSQTYSIDITNQPDSGLNTRNKYLALQKIKKVDRNEFRCSDKKILGFMETRTYIINPHGEIIEEEFSDTNGNHGKYCYKYDNFGSVIEKDEYKLTDNKQNRSGQGSIKKTRFLYEYYDDRGCILSITRQCNNETIKNNFNCWMEGYNKIVIKHNKGGDTVLKYDIYDNLIEECKISLLTNQEIKKTTYKYAYRNNKPVSVKKVVAEYIPGDKKNYWKYSVEYTKSLLYDEMGNIKSILFVDRNNKPYKLYKYNYTFGEI